MSPGPPHATRQGPVAVPHDAWAQAYDVAYGEEFGELLAQVTRATLALVAELVPARGAIVDFGAGTGRLAIPLAAAGHEVVAVEPSAAMLEVLGAKEGGGAVARVVARIEDFRGTPRFDLALCAFGVLSYLTTRASLDAAMAVVRSCLAPGGRLLLDLPAASLFASRRCETPRMTREVHVRPLGDGLHAYVESIELRDPSGAMPPRRYADRFEIRAWTHEDVAGAAARAGLRIEADATARIPASGARWLLLAPVARDG